MPPISSAEVENSQLGHEPWDHGLDERAIQST